MYFLEAAALTHTGKIRKKNEDNMFFDKLSLPEVHGETARVLTLHKRLDQVRIFAVFDGMGGYDCGEKSSHIAAEATKKKAAYRRADNISVKAWLLQLCNEINDQICELMKEKKIRTGTTIAMLLFENECIHVCNLGDSPVFRYRNHQLEEIFEEHSERKIYEQFIVKKSGRKKKYPLTQYAGIFPEEMKIEPYVAAQQIEAGDIYLICSDGLTDMVTAEEIAGILETEEDVERAADRLLKAALDAGGRDNITLICIRVAEKQQSRIGFMKTVFGQIRGWRW